MNLLFGLQNIKTDIFNSKMKRGASNAKFETPFKGDIQIFFDPSDEKKTAPK